MSIPATLTAASLLGLLLLALAWRCVQARQAKLKEPPADAAAADARVEHAMRVMANFSEYVPILLVLLAGLELGGMPDWLTFGLAGALVLARLLHAWGFSRSPGASFGRFYGTLLTWIVLLIASGTGLYSVLAG